MRSRLTKLAKQFRQGMTDAERVLWSRLKNQQLDGLKFRRLEPIGKYIVDFVNYEHKLIIELDGGQHSTTDISRKDANRTLWLEGEGFHVIRFWNNDVLSNMEGVIFTIQSSLRD